MSLLELTDIHGPAFFPKIR